jgi:hypothetical protein
MNRAPPDPRDVEAEGTAADLVAMFQADPTERRLAQIITGSTFVDLLSRVVVAADAEREAATLQQPGRVVTIQPIMELARGVDRARIVVSLRRPNLYELSKVDRLHRGALAAKLEGICRHAVPGQGLAGLAKWRAIFRPALMYGAAGKPATKAAVGGPPLDHRAHAVWRDGR